MNKFTDLKVLLTFTWFTTALTALVFSLFFLIYLSQLRLITPKATNFRLYAALPDTSISQSQEVIKADARALIIRNFFKGYKAPLEVHADTFITVSEKYHLDYRLLPAIAMQESNGGKKIIEDSFNPFGYGIYGGKVIRFASFEESIERVGRALREDYLNQGLTTPLSIMSKYTPPSLEKGGVWAKGVSSFMEELK